MKSLREINQQMNPEPVEVTPLTLAEQKYLANVALRLATFIREIHYNHAHACEKDRTHSTAGQINCIIGAYKYITEVGD